MSAATVETKIWLALKGRVETIPLAFPRAWPKQSFTPTTGQAWIRVTHLPNANSRPFLGSDDPMFRQGLLQIGLMTPLTGQVAEVDLQWAGSIAKHFWDDLPARTIFHDGMTVTIQRAPDVAGAFREDAWWFTPISIRYECFQ